jgi:hypothetical protein
MNRGRRNLYRWPVVGVAAGSRQSLSLAMDSAVQGNLADDNHGHVISGNALWNGGRRYTIVRRAVIFGLLTAVIASCGCGGSDSQRVVLTGAVTYQGEPVANGTVLFAPCDGTTGPSIVAKIVDGRYRTDSQGGLASGNYRVEILGYRKGAGDRQSPGPAPQVGPPAHANAPQQYLPEKYNVKTQLKTKVDAGAGSLTQDFTLAK